MRISDWSSDVCSSDLVCNSAQHQSLPPTQIVPRLADQGIYIASESSFYRVLREHEQVNHRSRAAAPHVPERPRAWAATAPGQGWSWDITFLPAAVRGEFSRLRSEARLVGTDGVRTCRFRWSPCH